MHKSFRNIIKRWESYQALADDLGEAYVTVQQWHLRDKIPPRVWPHVVTAASRRGYSDITLESLAALNSLYAVKMTRRLPPKQPRKRATSKEAA